MTPPKTPTKLQLALIDAALAIIDSSGHQALRARTLTDAAGCALGGLYTAFANLDALVLAAKLRILDQLDAIMRAATTIRQAPAPKASTQVQVTEELLALATAYVDFALDNKRRWQTLFLYKLANDAASPPWYLVRIAAIFAHIDLPLRALPTLDDFAKRDLAGRALFAGVHGIVILGVEARLGEVSREMLLAQITLLLGSAVHGLAQG